MESLSASAAASVVDDTKALRRCLSRQRPRQCLRRSYNISEREEDEGEGDGAAAAAATADGWVDGGQMAKMPRHRHRYHPLLLRQQRHTWHQLLPEIRAKTSERAHRYIDHTLAHALMGREGVTEIDGGREAEREERQERGER